MLFLFNNKSPLTKTQRWLHRFKIYKYIPITAERKLKKFIKFPLEKNEEFFQNTSVVSRGRWFLWRSERLILRGPGTRRQKRIAENRSRCLKRTASPVQGRRRLFSAVSYLMQAGCSRDPLRATSYNVWETVKAGRRASFSGNIFAPQAAIL